MNIKKKKILIIEDERFLVEMYRAKFEMEKFRIISAFSSEQGIKILEKEKPDLILLDILLPKKNGVTFLKETKKIRNSFKIPVIVFSNYDDSATKRKVSQLGVKDYLIKTQFTPGQLLEKIKGYFKD